MVRLSINQSMTHPRCLPRPTKKETSQPNPLLTLVREKERIHDQLGLLERVLPEAGIPQGGNVGAVFFAFALDF